MEYFFNIIQFNVLKQHICISQHKYTVSCPFKSLNSLVIQFADLKTFESELSLIQFFSIKSGQLDIQLDSRLKREAFL